MDGLTTENEIYALYEKLRQLLLKIAKTEFLRQRAKIAEILEDREKKGEYEDISIMIKLSIEKGNRISEWIQTLPIPLRQKLETLKLVYGLEEESHGMTLTKISYMVPIETCKMMRKSKHLFSSLDLKFFVPHIDAAVMHEVFYLLVPNGLKGIFNLIQVLNAIRVKKIGSPDMKNRPLHELVSMSGVVETDFCELNYRESDKQKAMVELGFCMRKDCFFLPTGDFYMMIVEGKELYKNILTEKWDDINDHVGYKKYYKKKLEKKVAEFSGLFCIVLGIMSLGIIFFLSFSV